ncbi:MAG: hypothetical protein QME25_08795, partial [Bacteroidota bacterium]|nr:hypothetical protein [Bacteroidota bacterium]
YAISEHVENAGVHSGDATKLILGQQVPTFRSSAFDLDYVGVKAPMFSFTRLKGSDPVLGVETEFLHEARLLQDMGIKIYATQGTAIFLKLNNIDAITLHWPLDGKEPNIISFLNERKIDLVINVPKDGERTSLEDM